MRPFWREEELTDSERRLLDACLLAHAQSVNRPNISSVCVRDAAQGSGQYTNALIAGISSLGWLHAPLIDTWLVLTGNIAVDELLKTGRKVPGWGSSFELKEWEPVAALLKTEHVDIWRRIEAITDLLKASGKNIDPNPSCYTAAVGMALKMPRSILPWLFIQGRLASWTMLFMDSISKQE